MVKHIIPRKLSSDSEDIDLIKRKRKPSIDSEDENIFFDKMKIYRDKINKNQITYEKIINANLSEEDTIWFIEHLDILNNLRKYTDEYYKLNTIIKDKYNSIINNKDSQDKINKLKFIKEDLITRIVNSEHNDYVKSLIFNKYKNIEQLEKNDETQKIIEWIETILEIPTKIKLIKDKNISESLYTLRDTMNKKLYGLNNVKERILETFCAMNTNPYYKKKFIE